MYMVEKSGKLLCRIVLIMLLFVLCFCASCGHKEARYALDMAEKRMWDEPDSALKVLESIVMPEDLEGKELADYALLLTQAQYRSNIVATSDSLINIAVGYYQDKDVEKRTASLLYKGGVLKDMGKDEDAMLVYKEAESYIPRIKDNRIVTLIYMGLGDLNQKNRNYALSIDYFKKSVAVNIVPKQVLSWKVSSIMNLANISYYWGNRDDADLYYSQLLDMVPLVDSMLQTKIYYNYGIYKSKEKEWAEAEKYVRKALDNASGDVSYRAMLLLANLYSRTGRDGEVDSLCQYALKTSEPAVKARIYYFLYEENVARKEYEDAVTYLSHYVLLSDTLRSQINRSEYLEIQKKYDQVVLLNKNVEIHNHWYLTIIISTVIIVALIGIHYLVLSINRKKKEKLLLKSKQEKVELQEKIDACQTKIAEDETMHNEEKEKLQMQITQLEAEKEQKDISIRRLEIICKSKDKDIPLEYIEALEMIMKLKSKEQASYNPAVDREKLHIWLDLVYDDFAGRLLEKYQLTRRERDVCYLKALDFSDDEISELLKIQLRSEERWIYRICEKFGFPKVVKMISLLILQILRKEDRCFIQVLSQKRVLH